MHFLTRFFRPVTLLVSVVVVSCGCDVITPKKAIVAGYYLEKSNEKFYYLQWKGHEDEGAGLLEGTVEQIGWTDSTILVLRRACSGGDPDGWMVIDTVNHSVRGPISDAERQTKYKTITCYGVDEAWKRR